jgi:predicted MFS family arabinose efflux permease
MTANLFGFPYTGMIAVIGREVLALDAFEIGLLPSAEGAGALIGALLIAYRVTPRLFSRVYLCGTALFLVAVFLFSLSSSYAVSMAVLFLGGFGVAGFGAMQSSIMFRASPPEVRGRVMGVLAVSIGSSPLGLLQVGLLANWLGAATAVSILAAEGMIALAVVCLLMPELLRWRGEGDGTTPIAAPAVDAHPNADELHEDVGEEDRR